MSFQSGICEGADAGIVPADFCSPAAYSAGDGSAGADSFAALPLQPADIILAIIRIVKRINPKDLFFMISPHIFNYHRSHFYCWICKLDGLFHILLRTYNLFYIIFINIEIPEKNTSDNKKDSQANGYPLYKSTLYCYSSSSSGSSALW